MDQIQGSNETPVVRDFNKKEKSKTFHVERPTSSQHQEAQPAPPSAEDLLAKAHQELEDLRAQLTSLNPEELSAEKSAEIQLQIAKLEPKDLHRIAGNELRPKDLKIAQEIIKALVCRIESLSQELQATAALVPSENETSMNRLRMNTLERQLLITETERNTLSEALRIACSRGEIDPVKEGQLEARELAGEAQP